MKLNASAIALITGAGSGLGAATARLLASKNVQVAILDADKTAAERVAAECKGFALHADVTDSAAVERAIEQLQQHGQLRVAINCAGIAPAKRVVGRNGAMPLEDFSRVININLIGTFNILRLAAHAMSQLEALNADGERGVIINTASIAAYEGQIGQTAYSASKAGIVGLTLPAARELAQHGIRVMTIAPGIFATPMVLAMPAEVQTNLAAAIPFPSRLGQPEEFAATAWHIIENSMLNGSVIRLDGGVRMQGK